MKAIVQDGYGSPDVLELSNVPKPEIAHDEVLVQVRAVSVGAWVGHLVRGHPHAMRLAIGLRKPRQPIRASDLAGEVVAVGTSVDRFAIGDAVYGEVDSAFAEFVAAPVDSLAIMPSNLSFVEAAAVPVAGLTALFALRDHGHVQAGQRLLIIGAAGGVGSFAVQLGKIMGAEVTAVCSSASVDFVRELGADHVIDYTTQAIGSGPERYDVIFQSGGNNSIAQMRKALTERGTIVLSSGEGGRWLGPLPRLAMATAMSPFIGPTLRTFVQSITPADLEYLTGLIERDELRPVIDATYPFAETANAVERFLGGHNRGKIVVTL
ncbi:MAG: NAD(P)-dependent alcohol dehydrogenase [Acidimicrobiales bacterium]|nr:NAD(P)-dependent alcohol dehydrogenase [Acidimicrobiales bacterium]